MELIAYLIGGVLSKLYSIYELDGKTKKNIKTIIVFIFFGLTLGLLLYAVFTKKGFYMPFVIGYMILMFVIRIITFWNRNYANNKYQRMIRIIKSFIQISFPVLIMIATTTFTNKTEADYIVLLLSIISFIILIIVDIFRVKKYIKKRNIRKNIK